MARLGNLKGRLTLVLAEGVVDVEHASGGRIPADPAAALGRWDEVTAWLASATPSPDAPLPADEDWLTPSPEPRQIIAVGINSRIKIEQFQVESPTEVGVISKLRSALADPFQPIAQWSEQVYVETEVALVIGADAWRVSEADALSHVAGLTVAQDLADLKSFIQLTSTAGGRNAAYWNPAKSLPGFAPVGPHLVTLDEVEDVHNIRLTLTIDGRVVQDGSTKDFVFSIPQIVSRLSHKVPLFAGDVILTGSPGQVEESPLEPIRIGSTVVSEVVGVGRQVHTIVEPAQSPIRGLKS